MQFSADRRRFLGRSAALAVGGAGALPQLALRADAADGPKTKNDRLGIAITYEEVAASVADGQVGRPHIARYLVEKNHAASMEEAFDHYLGTGASAWKMFRPMSTPEAPCSQAS